MWRLIFSLLLVLAAWASSKHGEAHGTHQLLGHLVRFVHRLVL
jgi:hypothetical protein